jgi:AcrR family transcriptional regulator
MTASPAPAHVNPPKQNRSRRTLERIVAASLELLATEGPSGLTVHRVVDKAESSVGSFYARFNGKEDLLDYLGERVWTEALDRWNDSLTAHDWSAHELADLVRASIGLLVDAQRSRSVYLKAIDQVSGRRAHAYDTFRAEVLSGVAGLLLTRADEMEHSNPDLAVRLGLRATMGILDGESRAFHDRLDREVLVDECSRLLLGYLAGADAGTAASGGPEFFDVWS